MLLALQAEVYSLALGLAQCEAAAAASGTTPSGGSRLAAAALHLLSVLPTCPAARQQLRQLLQAPDGGQQLRSLLQDQSGQAAVKPAVLMYATQCLAALLYPQQAEAEAAARRQDQADGEGGDAGGATAVEATAAAELLQRRLLLSGALEVVLELATQQAEPETAADPGIDAATHSAVLLLLLHAHESLQQQQAAAAAAIAAEAAAAAAAQQQQAAGGSAEEISAAAAVAAATAGVAALGDTSSMQVDSASAGPEPVGTDGGSSAAAAGAAPEAPAGRAEAAALDRSRSVSMEAEDGGASAGASAAAGGAAVVLPHVAAARQELEAAAAALSSLAPVMARYVLCMLCCLLRCHPEQQAADAQQAQQAQQAGGPIAAQAAALSQLASLIAVAELAEQGLQLLRQLAQHSSAAVEVATGAEAPAAEAVVRRLLLHPSSSRLRQLAADWLPSYAAASPVTHRWVFERIVQPLLLAEGAEGPAAAGQEQLSLCNHFIETLDYAEVGGMGEGWAGKRCYKHIMQHDNWPIGAVEAIRPGSHPACPAGLASLCSSPPHASSCRRCCSGW